MTEQLVSKLAQPSGNLTGIAVLASLLKAKRLNIELVDVKARSAAAQLKLTISPALLLLADEVIQ